MHDLEACREYAPRAAYRFATAALLAAILSFNGLGASARVVVTYESDGQTYFSLSVPDEWMIATRFEASELGVTEKPPYMPRILSMLPKDDRVFWFGLWRARSVRNFDEAKARFSDLTDFVMDEASITKNEERVINSMAAHIASGTGTKNGEPVQFGILLFQIAPETIGVGLYLGEPTAWGQYGDMILEVLCSLRPAVSGRSGQ